MQRPATANRRTASAASRGSAMYSPYLAPVSSTQSPRSIGGSTAAGYNGLTDPHLQHYFANRPHVRGILKDLGLVNNDLRVVEDADYHMKLVDRALLDLQTIDVTSMRDEYVDWRGKRLSSYADKKDKDRSKQHDKIVAEYAKERKRRAEFQERCAEGEGGVALHSKKHNAKNKPFHDL